MWGSEALVFELLFLMVFAMVAAFIAANLVKDTKEWNQNNHSPRLTIPCKIVGKRAEVSYTQRPIGGDVNDVSRMQMVSCTTHYVTFQADDGEQMEFSVDDREYGLLSEGEFGKLSFQGTRFLDFEKG